ncbi:acetyltransferase [Phyllobacterium endophyticum]|nr:acetyltransferase [Phyllobacterium endophyticum]
MTRTPVIVMGAGGHAKVCIELLRASGKQVDFAIGADVDSGECVGVPILAGDANLARLRREGYTSVFIAVGSNSLREKLAGLATEQGYILVNAISPNATISPTASVGSGVAIMAGAVINADSTIADLAIINTGTTVDHDCRIGRAAHLAPQCALAGNVLIGERTFLGIGTKVIPNVIVESDSIVGAGSVVISNIGRGVTALGVPARSRLK